MSDDDDAGHGRHEERRHPEGEEQMRVAVQQPAADQIKNGIDDAARKPGHRVYFRLLVSKRREKKLHCNIVD